MKKAMIFAGGEFGGAPQTKNCFTVCADGGYKNAVKAKIVPDVVIGDMDSIGDIPENIETVRASTRKDETDTQLCIDYLAEKGYDDITVVCALGGRCDHEFANLMLTVYGANRGVKVTLQGDNVSVSAIKGKAVFKGSRGDTFSMFPVGGDAEGVTTQGLSYSLSGDTLKFDTPMGISNVFTADEACVSARKGIIIAIHFRGEQK